MTKQLLATASFGGMLAAAVAVAAGLAVSTGIDRAGAQESFAVERGDCNKIVRWAVNDADEDAGTDTALVLEKCPDADHTWWVTERSQDKTDMITKLSVPVEEPAGYALPRSGLISRYWKGQSDRRDAGHVRKRTGRGESLWEVSNNFAWSHSFDDGKVYPTGKDEAWVLLLVDDANAIWCSNIPLITGDSDTACTTHPDLLDDPQAAPWVVEALNNAGKSYVDHRDELAHILADRLGVPRDDLCNFVCRILDAAERDKE